MTPVTAEAVSTAPATQSIPVPTRWPRSGSSREGGGVCRAPVRRCSGTSTIVVTGPPAAGKTSALVTLANQLTAVARFGVKDHAVRLASEGHPLGARLAPLIAQHAVFPDDEVACALDDFLCRVDGVEDVIVIEGYPRNLRQVADLDRLSARHRLLVRAFVVVEVPQRVALERAMGRWVCESCRLPIPGWHPARPCCPTCRGQADRRADDAVDRLRARYADYRRVAAEVHRAFEKRGLLHTIDGCLPQHRVVARLRSLFASPNRSSTPPVPEEST